MWEKNYLRELHRREQAAMEAMGIPDATPVWHMNKRTMVAWAVGECVSIGFGFGESEEEVMDTDDHHWLSQVLCLSS